jgi:hypothetical protein
MATYLDARPEVRGDGLADDSPEVLAENQSAADNMDFVVPSVEGYRGRTLHVDEDTLEKFLLTL